MYLLAAKKIFKRYRTSTGEFYALRSCSMAFPSRGLIAIEGKSGSGKSTLLNILAGIETPSGGAVFYRGKIASGRFPLVSRHGGMVFQHYNLFDGMTALENVALPGKMSRGKKKRAEALMHHFRLDDLIHKDARVLSGGEKQRVAICRALMNNPPILFCDEPTGALDEANSLIVMNALKEISRKKLVLVVSHNHALVERYADSVIAIKDGKVSGSLPREPCDDAPEPKQRHSSSWLGRFLFRNARRNVLKDVMCFLSGIVGFASLLLSFGYMQGNMPAMEVEQRRCLNYLTASISKRSAMEIPGTALTLVKKSIAEPEEVEEALSGLGEYDLVTNYEYFFPSAMPFDLDEETMEPCAFSPLMDITLKQHGADAINWGEAPEGVGLTECVVNQEFVEKYGEASKGAHVTVTHCASVTIGGKSRDLYVNAKLQVKAVVREFGFLNVPRVYYSYPGLDHLLRDIRFDEEIPDIDSLIEGGGPDSVYGSYSQLVFFSDASQIPALFQRIENPVDSEVEISSDAHALWQSFSSLSNAFVASLALFVGLALVGLALILGMASYSSFVSGRKESAILTVLGARRHEVFSIYVLESVLLCFGSAALSLVLSPFLQGFLNDLLFKKFDVHDLISIPFRSCFGVPLLVPIVLLGGAMLIGLISALIPMLVHRRIPLVEELRDE